MRFLQLASTLTLPAFALGLSVADAATGQSDRPDVSAALQAIRHDADSVAAGRFSGSKALQAPARDIALQWEKVAPVLSTDGNVLVETKMSNASIVTFEKDWQSKSDVRGEARSLSANIGDLMDAAKGKS